MTAPDRPARRDARRLRDTRRHGAAEAAEAAGCGGEPEDGGEVFDPYAYAYLAGGGLRVAESAVLALIERGTVSMAAARVRVVGEVLPEHPVERAVLDACPRSKPVDEVIERVADSGVVDELARGLVLLGLAGRRRRKANRTGRRRLAEATAAGHVPPYVLHAHAVRAPGATARRGNTGARPGADDGLGRALIRMGKALDDDRGHGTEGGGFAGGGGGGGGD
ncbi:TIGR04222 domain-containing membrane protein [Streptomyces sp. NPDC096351]|uniref:TIGR04222 domain-containing membrane protein n=1 Tax=Streptomyces sp. NPDC096351 TaxID=3366087 RepID=UPI00382A2751